MNYAGGKHYIAKDIVPIILANRQPGQWFIEPFCGAVNITIKVPGNRIANDSHYYLIKMWKAVQNGWIPPQHLSELLYKQIKQYPDRYLPELVSFAGFACSYGAIWFGSYSTYKKGKREIRYAKNSILKKAKHLDGVIFTNMDYRQLFTPENSLIYCDPPYERANNSLYTGVDKFNNSTFWQWCRDKSKDHTIFVSEYTAPDDFECIWEKEYDAQYTRSKVKNIERLFRCVP